MGTYGEDDDVIGGALIASFLSADTIGLSIHELTGKVCDN